MTANSTESERIVTVTGPIAVAEMGLTLPHEHIMLDMTKPGEQSPDHDRVEIRRRILPYLEEIKKHGVQTFVECTPMYICRDPILLREISEETGIRIVTNTGQYKPPALPRRTYEISDEELAEEWIAEARDGIGGTGILPGFVKTAVEGEPLQAVNRKVIRAAALTSSETGLPIATHTGAVIAANEVLDIIEKEGVAPETWIFVHAQNETDMDALTTFAKRGSWIELDGIGPDSVERHMRSLLALLAAGRINQVMLSHDKGWYTVGEPDGGDIKPYTFLFTDFIPLLKDKGVSQAELETMMIANPAKAFAVG